MVSYGTGDVCAFYASQYFNVTDPIFVTSDPGTGTGTTAISMYPNVLGANPSKSGPPFPPLNLTLVLGSRQMARKIAVPMTIVYSIILATGLLGNLLTCAVIVKTAAMHTATNYYLFNLAFADLLSLVIGMPQELYSMWIQYPYPFGSFMCSFRALVSEMTTYSSILCITAFTIERYFAICHPFYAHRLSDLNRVIKIIAGVWIVAAANAIPFSLLTRINYVCDFGDRPIPDSAWCGVPFNMPYGKYVPLLLWSAFAFLVVPMAVLVVLYIRIGLKLKASARLQLMAGGGGGKAKKVEPAAQIVITKSAASDSSFCEPSKLTKRIWGTRKGGLFRGSRRDDRSYSTVDAMLVDSPGIYSLSPPHPNREKVEGTDVSPDKNISKGSRLKVGTGNAPKRLHTSLTSIVEEGLGTDAEDESHSGYSSDVVAKGTLGDASSTYSSSQPIPNPYQMNPFKCRPKLSLGRIRRVIPKSWTWANKSKYTLRIDRGDSKNGNDSSSPKVLKVVKHKEIAKKYTIPTSKVKHVGMDPSRTTNRPKCHSEVPQQQLSKVGNMVKCLESGKGEEKRKTIYRPTTTTSRLHGQKNGSTKICGKIETQRSLPQNKLHGLRFNESQGTRSLTRFGWVRKNAASGILRVTTESMRTKSEFKRTRSRTDAIKMLVAVVVTFFICWAPFNAQRLLFVFVKTWTTEKRMIMEKLYNVTGCLYYANSTVNPILYNLMSKRFRKAFFEILCPSCHPKVKRGRKHPARPGTQMTEA